MGDKTHKILILGDGNLSFASSLVHRLQVFPSKFEVVATCYDNENEVLRKYPESKSFMTNLRKMYPHVKLFFAISATSDLKMQLEKQGSPFSAFRSIVFNFPHLGIEDCSAHSSLLAHFICEAGKVLDSTYEDSSIYVTLTELQCALWSLEKMATRNQMRIIIPVPFRASEWPQYTQR